MMPRRDPGAPPLVGPRRSSAPPSPEGVRHLVQVRGAEIESQLGIAERTDAKARTRFVLAAAIFIGAQMLILLGNAFTNPGDDKPLLLEAALIAGILVGLALVAIAAIAFVRRDRRFESDPLRRWLRELEEPAHSEAEISARIVQPYKDLMHERQANGLARARWLRWVLALWLIAILAAGVELVFAVQGLA